VQAVLLDAFGTLLELDDPARRLGALLAADGHPHPAERVGSALAAEIAYYRRNLQRGRDAASLASLRLECAAVLAEGLGDDVPPPRRLAQLLVECLRFTLAPDALPALDALGRTGVRLAVVSNWDCSLPEVLAGLGVAGRFAAICTSAAVGAAKPDPAIFLHALGILGVAPERALHCGDSPDADCAGARSAGLEAVLIDRAAVSDAGPCRRIRTLVELLPWVAP
jgi:putative hydrolase of the HAD superfamily